MVYVVLRWFTEPIHFIPLNVFFVAIAVGWTILIFFEARAKSRRPHIRSQVRIAGDLSPVTLGDGVRQAHSVVSSIGNHFAFTGTASRTMFFCTLVVSGLVFILVLVVALPAVWSENAFVSFLGTCLLLASVVLVGWLVSAVSA